MCKRDYVVGPDCCFAAAIRQFAVAIVSVALASRHNALDEGLCKVTDFMNQRVSSTPASEAELRTLVIDLPPLDKPIAVGASGCDEALLLHRVGPISQYIQGLGKEPSPLLFSLVSAAGGMDLPLQNIRSSFSLPWISDLACYLIGWSFESVKERIRSRYGPVRDWPPSLTFFRHLRNGCFHGNRFNIRESSFTRVATPSWHSYTMHSLRKLNGQKVIDGWFKMPHVLPFLHDYGVALSRLGHP